MSLSRVKITFWCLRHIDTLIILLVEREIASPNKARLYR